MRLLAAYLVVALAAAALPAPAPAQQPPNRFAAPDQAYAKKDYATAHKLWLALAEEGNGSAYFNLGRLYLFGEGVTIDMVEAYKWFEMSNKAGVPQAKSGLARLAPLMTKADVEEAERRIERWYSRYPNTRR